MDKKRFQTYRTPRRLVHCCADCRDCDWQEEWYLTASRKASQHVRETGHRVTIEQGIHYEVKAAHGGEPTHD